MRPSDEQIDAIAAHIPGATVYRDEMSSRGAHIAVDGLSIHQFCGNGVPRGMVGFAAYPAEYWQFAKKYGHAVGFMVSPRHEIRVSWDKPAEKIARDIVRRLLPQAGVVAAAWREHAEKHIESQNEHARNVERFRKLRGMQVQDDGRYYFRAGDILIHGEIGQSCVSVRHAHGFTFEDFARMAESHK